MKQLYLKFLFLGIFSLLGIKAEAYDCRVNGISYDLNNTDYTASVMRLNTTYSGSITIPSFISYNGSTYSVTSIGDYAFYECSGLTSVTIPNSVTSIGSSAFSGCSGLTSVTIPNSVTSIGSSAFSGCSGLTSVTIPNSVTSIGGSAFFGCIGLTSVIIPSSVTSIGGSAFTWCNNLATVTINSNAILSKSYSHNSNLNTIFGSQVTKYVLGEGVTSIGNNAFYGCSGLTSVNIPSGVTSIGDGAFDGCSGLTSVVIPYGVTSIGNTAFCYCSGLTSVVIPNSVTSIGTQAFCWCNGLTSIVIPSSVTTIRWAAFGGCSGLTSVVIPNSVTSIENYAFMDCNNLATVTINSNAILSKNYPYDSNLKEIFGDQVTEYVLGEGITSIGDYAFKGCSGLTSIEIPNSVTSIGSVAFLGCSGLTSVEIPSGVTSIGDCAFQDCTGLTSVVIPSGVTSIEFGVFKGCSGLTSIEIPNSVTSIGSVAFVGCSGLTSIVIPNSVTSIGQQAFRNCTGLTSVVIPSGVTSIEFAVFEGCSGLTSIVIPNSVTSIGGSAFYSCSGLTSIAIPNSVTNIKDYTFWGCSGLTSFTIGKSVTSFGYQAFYNCSGLKTVTINSNAILSKNYLYDSNLKEIFGDQVTKYVIGEGVTSIGNDAFHGCSGLTSVVIPSSVISIGDYAFQSCSGLTSVVIPSSVTSIGQRAFSGCYNLATVTINSNAILSKSYSSSSNIDNIFGSQVTEYVLGEGITSIGSYAFCGCSGLTSITIPSSVTSIGESAFYGCSDLTSVAMGNNVTYIGIYAFPNKVKILVNKGTKSLITLWNSGITAYNIATEEQIPSSSISLVSSTQVSVTVKITDYYDGYTYTIDDEFVNKGEEKTYSGISHSLTLRVSLDDVSYTKIFSFKSKGLGLTIDANTTSSSINVMCSYIHGDAVVTSEEIYMNGIKVSDGNTYYISGLNPNTTYTIKYSTNYESISETVYTDPLSLKTSQPKVISSGNVIVAAETNLDNEETNVGFEWRRTDWTDDFTSNSGTAYLYNGVMEGYIRNLNTEKLWKYRPYYTSNAGKTYYGEWVGIDPTNTSYFEPTVHTYANVSVNGNTAEVKGYVQRGTDNVVSKGFAYWEQSEGMKAREAMSAPSMISSLPSNAKTVEVSGSQQVMTASLSDLEYETTYCYVAFVRTSEGDTFYGEPREFTTDIDVTGIRDVDNDKAVTVKQRYDQNGMLLSSPRRGLNILLMSDGSTKKVWVK